MGKHDLAGLVGTDQAAQAHADLLDLAIEHWPYEVLGPRAWELRQNLSVYDATYVALAELTGATLVTRLRPGTFAARPRAVQPTKRRRPPNRSRLSSTMRSTTRRSSWVSDAWATAATGLTVAPAATTVHAARGSRWCGEEP